jgi:hypothetical protein
VTWAYLFLSDIHFSGEITLGSILSSITFVAMTIVAYKDLQWRVRNLEVWRKEHMLDADARDNLLKSLSEIAVKLNTLIDRRSRH